MILRPNLASRPIISHLMTFIAVAETRSFRRAAELVGRSQPAVTAQIQQLETLLGVSLFTRTTRNVQPTAAGTELLERAKKLVVATDKLIRDFQSQASLMSGRVALSVSPTLAGSMVGRFLVLFEHEYPDIVVSIREDLSQGMFEALMTGDVDVGIGPYRDVPEGLTFQPLFEQPFFLILPADHAMARRGQVPFRDVAALALLCPAKGTTARALIDGAAAAAGIEIRPKYEALHYQTLTSLAAAGLGATIMPLTDRRVLAALGLVAVPFQDVRLSREVGVIARRDESLSPAAEALVRLLVLLSANGLDIGETGLRGLAPRGA